MGFMTIYLIAVTSLNFVQSFPADTPPPTPEPVAPTNASASTTLPPHQLAFENCDFVADCTHMHGKIPIPCANDYCDRFLLCIDNRPTMQQCDPVKHFFFWNTKTNFNPLSLQCEEDFKTCDWYLTVRLSSGDEHEAKSAINTSTGYDTTPIKSAADSAKDGLLNDLKQRASEVIQHVTNSTTEMITRLKLKTEEISKDVQADTLAILQKLKDGDAKNSTHMAQVVMRSIIDQIHVSSGQVKDGIASVVSTMKEKISGVLSSFQENATKEIESAREALHKVLPKPIENLDELVEPTVDKEVVKEENKEDEKEEVVKPVEPKTEEVVKPVEPEVIESRSENTTTMPVVNVTVTKASFEEMMQGDDPPREEVTPEEKVVDKEKKDKEVSEDKKDKPNGSAAVTSASYLIAATSAYVVIAQVL